MVIVGIRVVLRNGVRVKVKCYFKIKANVRFRVSLLVLVEVRVG